MYTVLTNQIAGILHFSDKSNYSILNNNQFSGNYHFFGYFDS